MSLGANRRTLKRCTNIVGTSKYSIKSTIAHDMLVNSDFKISDRVRVRAKA